MKKVKIPKGLFQIKVTLVLFGAMFIVLFVSNLMVFKYNADAQFEDFRSTLKTTTQTAALIVDPVALERVPLNPLGIYSPEFKRIQNKLAQIKDVNPQIKYLYTLKKTDRQGIWQFIVDADTVTEDITEEDLDPNNDDPDPYSFPGDEYEAGRFSEMLKAYDGASVDKHLETDEWGITLSGYAPIKDQKGDVIAILGIDISADDIHAIRQQAKKRMVWVLLLCTALSFFLGFVIARPIVKPVEELVEGTRRIAQGNLTYRVATKGNDEINELAEAFNTMARSLYKSKRRVLGYFHNMVNSLVRILEARDQYTKGHSQAVARIAGLIAVKMGVPREDIKLFKKMTILHDIGKIGIRDNILNKPGKLTDEEWKIIKKHPEIGEGILKPVIDDKDMLSIVRGHHERYDGKGYPDQLKGKEINILTAIVTVADTYHAMTSNRSYRKAMSKAQAIDELIKCKGTQFHPRVVEAFLEILNSEKGA